MSKSSHEILIVQRFDALPATVFDTLVHLNADAGPPLPAGVYRANATHEPRVGSSFIVTDHLNKTVKTGRFLELDNPQLIVYSLSPGERAIIEITGVEDMSEVALAHVHGPAEHADRIHEGWLRTLGEVRKKLSAESFSHSRLSPVIPEEEGR